MQTNFYIEPIALVYAYPKMGFLEVLRVKM